MGWELQPGRIIAAADGMGASAWKDNDGSFSLEG
jgi:hypothetical protein